MKEEVLLINSNAGDKIYFRRTQDYLKINGIDAIIISPTNPDHWKLEEYEKYAESFLEKGNKYILGGYSYGGNVAYEIAKKHPYSVKKLALIDCTPDWKYQLPEFRAMVRALHIMPDFLKKKIVGNKDVLGYMLDEMIASKIDVKDKLIEKAQELGGKYMVDSMHSGIKYTSKEDNTQVLKDLAEKIEVHFIYGSESEDVKGCIKKAVLEKSKIRLHEIEKSGHLLMLEQADKFNETLLKILK